MRRKNVKRLISLQEGPNRITEGPGVAWLLEENYIDVVYTYAGGGIFETIEDLPTNAEYIIPLYILTEKGINFLKDNRELFIKRGLNVKSKI